MARVVCVNMLTVIVVIKYSDKDIHKAANTKTDTNTQGLFVCVCKVLVIVINCRPLHCAAYTQGEHPFKSQTRM